ncbi:MAG: hypothetical protein JXB26_02335 [Candidatus Aminicenantes bacterium]|nr:hypothetical protein [Candidatus Aminicenantes bacterium]
MNTKKFFAGLFFVALVFLINTMGFARDQVIESTWSLQPLNIDGSDKDWQGATLMTEKKVKVNYAVMNDAEYIYVLFIFRDPQYLTNINQTGMTIYFNTEGKKKKNEGFNFIQKKATPEELIAYLKKQGQVLTDQQIQSIKSKPQYILFMAERIGKKDELSVVQSAQALQPGFKTGQKEKDIIFEFKVPLAHSEFSPEGIGIEPGQSLKIGFEWGGMTEELTKRLRDQGVNISEGGIDSGRTTGGAPSAASRRMPKKYDFWFDVQLAPNR